MRASQAKSKFLFWFVVLEELEARDEFKTLFTPLFSEDEKKSLMSADLNDDARNRVKQLLRNPAATRESRAQKLLNILNKIGLSEVEGLQGALAIDVSICKSLIKQRNNIAHKGARIDVNQLYTILFPLAQGALVYLCREGDQESPDQG